MADSSLDDFFAKKDKSKKKNKSKVTPNDLLEKQKLKKKKMTSEKKKEENKDQQTDVDPSKMSGIQNDDEEWLDVQEEEKDYTGLRIQNLQIGQEKDESEKETEDKGSDDEDDESGEKKDGASGVWGKVDAPVAPVVQKPPEPEPEPKKDEAPAKPGKYVPPGARQAAASQSHLIGPGMGPSARRGKKAAPNLQSEEDFPTLGVEAPVIDSAWGSGKFEKVKSGGRQTDDPAQKGPQLSLGNKYTALQGGTE